MAYFYVFMPPQTYSLVNLIPLYLGGRTSFIVDRILKFDLGIYHLFHKWTGRGFVGLGFVHGIYQLSQSRWRMTLREILLCTHISLAKTSSLVALSMTSAFWAIHLGHSQNRVLIQSLSNTEGNSTAVFKVFISPKKTWQVKPGQYVYISMPGIARRRFGFLQSHPYLIAWQLPNKDLILLVSRQSGFSNHLITSTPQSTLILDGQYGSPYDLGNYDKVIFFAQGIGIAAHLLTIKSLLYANHRLTARIRRLTLIWFLEDKGKLK
ncbi:hypothetical protein EJ05DRAFT_295178 [Pseudovirgaria hyperparasitica]|uniref:ferric-chelate reductase (NADPH) n=1 Tax=Pseudovirgaria hyperparasitica TaxID=470096 RepID=A0A6A6VS60_9PEZI|nr:uncharacterized protein EJ05DRAFT_295178 [Pseudovirgaria hyperparasitica]KAF2752594.1 hypothetical protein EJ05DRAFT_295178 [Pseudovirgaria hyperparasitica]